MSDVQYNAIPKGDETNCMWKSMQDMKPNLCYLTAVQLLELYESKTVSPVEVAKAIFERIDAVDGDGAADGGGIRDGDGDSTGGEAEHLRSDYKRA